MDLLYSLFAAFKFGHVGFKVNIFLFSLLLFSAEYYPNCEVVFMGMANIHSIRRSFQSLRLLCTQMPDPGK